MKCSSCSVDVPPTFSKAIMDNICPACGKEIFRPAEFKELLKVKDILKDAGLDDKITVSTAAILSSKYDIILKTQSVSRRVQPALTKEEIDATEGLSEEERMRLRAQYAAEQENKVKMAAQIKAEWGLNHGDMVSSALSTETKSKKLIDPEMAALFSDMQTGDAELSPPLDMDPMLSAKNIERMQRAELLRSDPGRFKITRSE